jgi:hypothetical protein
MKGSYLANPINKAASWEDKEVIEGEGELTGHHLDTSEVSFADLEAQAGMA